MGNFDPNTLWPTVLENLQSSGRVAPRTIDTLLRPLEPIDAAGDASGGVFLLQAPNEFSRDWVARSFGPVIEEQLGQLTGVKWSLHWMIAPPAAKVLAKTDKTQAVPPANNKKTTAPKKTAPAPTQKEQSSSSVSHGSAHAHGSHAPVQAKDQSRPVTQPQVNSPVKAQRPPTVSQPAPIPAPTATPTERDPKPSSGAISRGLHQRYTFNNFVTGPSNQLAHAAALALSEKIGRKFNPLFLCGNTGLGKTHLVNAVGHRVLEQNSNASVIYVSAEHFMNEFVGSLRSGTMADFRTRYREQCDCLLMDDIQFFAGKDQLQEEFFHTFNALFLHDKPIVLTSDVAPSNLKGMAERLISRFSSGLVAEVYMPELETRIAIIRKKAELEGLHLDNDAAMAIAEVCSTNVRDLEGTLMKFAIQASLSGRHGVDGAMVRQTLRLPTIPQKGATITTVEDIQRAVCDHYRIKIAQLTGKERHQEVALPRQVAMYLCRERLGTSFPQIGHKFGGKDHTTVISAVNKVKKMASEDLGVQRDLSAIAQRLG